MRRLPLLFALPLTSLASFASAQTGTSTAVEETVVEETVVEEATVTESATAAAAAETPRRKTEEVYITGTRLRRKDLATPAPVTVLYRKEIEESGHHTIGNVLQDLPSQIGGINAQYNNAGDGSTRVDLRGLGASRTLVLLNGRRMVPGGVGANDSVDLESIPIGVIDRIEILKDGASALYGSDAIAGVVNIITRDDFTGVEGSIYTGGTQHGGFTYKVGATAGTTVDKGSFLISFEHARQKEILAGARDFSRSDLDWDYESKSEYPEGSSAVPETFVVDYYGQVGNAAWQELNRRHPGGPGEVAFINHPVDGWRAATFDGNTDSGNSQCLQEDGSTKPCPVGDLYNYQPENYLLTPNERLSLWASGDYQLNRLVTGYVEALYTNRRASQLLAPEPIFIDDYNIVLSANSAYNPFGIEFEDTRRRLVEAGNRQSNQDRDTYRAVVGLTGKLTEAENTLGTWRWDGYFAYGRTEGIDTNNGNLIRSRVQQAIGPSFFDATGKAVCGTPDNPIPNCVPLNLFGGAGSITPEMLENLTYTGTTRGFSDQLLVSASATGDLFKLWDRPAGLAFGYMFRDESGAHIPEPYTAKGDSTNNVIRPTSGEYREHAMFAEIGVPLLADLPGVELLEANAAIRVFNFDTFGWDNMYKFGGRWQIFDLVAIRGTYSRAFRAPSVVDLFEGNAEDNQEATDPCDTSAGPRASATIDANCRADGVPDNFPDPRNQITTIVGGNPDLEPETANTLTAGIVITPKGNEWIEGLTVTLDYFNVDVDQAIQGRGSTVILANCYAQPNRSDCAAITRDPDNKRIEFITDINANIGGNEIAGLDITLSYVLKTDAGRFDFGFDGVWLQKYDEIFQSRVIKGKGLYDVGAVFPAFRFNAEVDWAWKGLSLGALLQYVGPIQECANNDCSPAALEAAAADEMTVSRDVAANMQIDVHAGYGFSHAGGLTSISAGITNVLDQEPPRIYNGFYANSDASAYDYIGRFFYVALEHRL